MRRRRHEPRMAEIINIYKILVRISEGYVTLGRPKCVGKDKTWFDL
jgi:hypothetical protein